MALILVLFGIIGVSMVGARLSGAITAFRERHRTRSATELVYEYHALLRWHGVHKEIDVTLKMPWAEIVPRPVCRSAGMLALAEYWYLRAESSDDLDEQQQLEARYILFTLIGSLEDEDHDRFLEGKGEVLADVLRERTKDPAFQAFMFGIMQRHTRPVIS